MALTNARLRRVRLEPVGERGKTLAARNHLLQAYSSREALVRPLNQMMTRDERATSSSRAERGMAFDWIDGRARREDDGREFGLWVTRLITACTLYCFTPLPLPTHTLHPHTLCNSTCRSHARCCTRWSLAFACPPPTLAVRCRHHMPRLRRRAGHLPRRTRNLGESGLSVRATSPLHVVRTRSVGPSVPYVSFVCRVCADHD